MEGCASLVPPVHFQKRLVKGIPQGCADRVIIREQGKCFQNHPSGIIQLVHGFVQPCGLSLSENMGHDPGNAPAFQPGPETEYHRHGTPCKMFREIHFLVVGIHTLERNPIHIQKRLESISGAAARDTEIKQAHQLSAVPLGREFQITGQP